jgi:hypothetical protein
MRRRASIVCVSAHAGYRASKWFVRSDGIPRNAATERIVTLEQELKLTLASIGAALEALGVTWAIGGSFASTGSPGHPE